LNLIQVILAEGNEISNENSFDTRVLAEVAIAVALATVLSMIKIWQMPQGGSVTLGSMVPLLLIAFRRDIKIGVLTGVIYGLVQLVLGGWYYHPAGMFLDYPLAFGVLGLAAIFKKMPTIGVIVALSLRFISHFLSGVIFFAEYTPEGMSPFVYSAIYNGSYIIPEIIVSAILIYLLVQRDVLNMNF
jgi:thiamine transporter